MTQNASTPSRRERRRAAERAARTHQVRTAGRTAAVAMAASGLVITGGVGAHATVTEEGRELTTVALNSAELDVERASSARPAAVGASEEAELSFDRPVVSTTAVSAEESTGGPEPAESTDSGATVASQQAPAEESAPAPASSGIVGAAYAAIGTPYVWGGNTLAGLDCSGFVNWAYSQAGMPLSGQYRSTSGLAALPQVTTPQPGDIVLSIGGTHAGIYVGNGQVISSMPGDGVYLHSMYESWHTITSIHRPF